MKNFLTLCLIIVALSAWSQSKLNVKKEFEFAAKQYEGMLSSHQDITQFPQSTNPDGSPRNMKSSWWCSGFLEVHFGIFMNSTKPPNGKTLPTNGQWPWKKSNIIQAHTIWVL
jgi:unsaturated chondroitin disaccharide hydrolase